MLMRSGESHLAAVFNDAKIAEIYTEGSCGPFPYEDCRWLRREFQGNLDGLIPDLDMWFFDIFGYASRGKRLMKLSDEEALRARAIMSLSFYEKHPEYAWLERHIVASDTPDLFEEMNLAERSRTMLLNLFDLMLSEKFMDV